MSDIIKKSVKVNKVVLSEVQLERLAKDYNIKELDKNGVLLGKIAVYDNVDCQGEVIRKGAFQQVIEKYQNNDLEVAINIDHDNTKVVGVLKHIIDDYECNFGNEPSVLGCVKMFEIHKRNGLHKKYNSFSIEGRGSINKATGEISYVDLTAIALTNTPANPRANVFFAKSTIGNLPQYPFSINDITLSEAETKVNELVNTKKEYRKSKMYLYITGNGYDLLVCDVIDNAPVYNVNLIQEAYNKFNTKEFFNKLSYKDTLNLDMCFKYLSETASNTMGVENIYKTNPILSFIEKMNTLGDVGRWLKENTDLRKAEIVELAEKCIIEETASEMNLNLENLEIEYENKIKVVDKSFLFLLSKGMLDKYIMQDYNDNAGVNAPAPQLQNSNEEAVTKSLELEVQNQKVLSFDDILKKYNISNL